MEDLRYPIGRFTFPEEVTPGASLALLDSLHQRWVRLLESVTDSDFQRAFRHPELGLVRLDRNVALYAWHGRHHVAHILCLRKRRGW
jgi:DinB superfamily